MKSLGQICYEAQTHHAQSMGYETQDWIFLTNEAKDMWEYTAEAVEQEVKSRMEPDE